MNRVSKVGMRGEQRHLCKARHVSTMGKFNLACSSRAVYHDQGVAVAGTWGSGSHHIHSQEAEKQIDAGT